MIALTPRDVLGHVVVEVSDISAWVDFLGNVLGLEQATAPDGPGTTSAAFAMDEHAARIILTEGTSDEVSAVGIWLDEVRLAELRDVLEGAGHPATRSPVDLAASRFVRELWTVEGPDGLRIELGTQPSVARHRYDSVLVPDGFVTGDRGLGHLVLWSESRLTAAEFYIGLFGWRRSGTLVIETPRGVVEVEFLACNDRHHTVAFGSRPPTAPRGLRTGHLMLETATVDGLGMILDRVLDRDLLITRSLGRHYGDEMLSFYVRSPSGFEIEIGTGSKDSGDLLPKVYRKASVWGHRMAAAS